MTSPAWRRIIYLLCFVFFTWLALATRSQRQWFHPFIITYGGDTIWAGMFLFFLRMIFLRTALWKLALIAFCLGVADEISQLYHAPWADAVRATTPGRLLFGVGFLWSDMLCYAVGIAMAFIIISIMELRKPLAVSP